MTPKRVPVSSIPLKPVVYHILAALANGSKHGYAIKRDIVEQSQRRLDLDPGTLYRLIGRLLEDDLIEELSAPELEPEDARRRYYQLTDKGRRVFVAETKRMAGLVDAARAHGVIGKPGTAQ